MDIYIFNADIYCAGCGDRMQSETEIPIGADFQDSTTFPQGPYPNGGGEADTPQHCGDCDIFLENPLTSDGEQYVTESFEHEKKMGIKDGTARAVNIWADFYDYLKL